MPENPETFDAGQSTYSVTLPSFEGPLDLLLHLCQKHELNILDIPIAFVTSKYLEYLAVMQLMNLDVASEYLLMAATLAHIKSKMLLPAPPPEGVLLSLSSLKKGFSNFHCFIRNRRSNTLFFSSKNSFVSSGS